VPPCFLDACCDDDGAFGILIVPANSAQHRALHIRFFTGSYP
jgi:hypothetical protein